MVLLKVENLEIVLLFSLASWFFLKEDPFFNTIDFLDLTDPDLFL